MVATQKSYYRFIKIDLRVLLHIQKHLQKNKRKLLLNLVEKDILIPRYYWQSKELELIDIAEEKGLNLISLKDLIEEKCITYFDGHGSPKGELKGEGEIPYIRVKDIVNWQIYKDPTAMIPQSEYERLFTKNKTLRPKDILFVRRGSYRIGSVAIVSKNDLDVILTR